MDRRPHVVALENRERNPRRQRLEGYLQGRGVGRGNRETDPFRPHVRADRRDGPRGHREDSGPGSRERRRLRRRKLVRVEIGERVASESGGKIGHGRIALSHQHQGRRKVGVRLDALSHRDPEGPLRRDDLAQERQGPLEVEPFVVAPGAPQECSGRVLRRGRGRGR